MHLLEPVVGLDKASVLERLHSPTLLEPIDLLVRVGHHPLNQAIVLESRVGKQTLSLQARIFAHANHLGASIREVLLTLAKFATHCLEVLQCRNCDKAAHLSSLVGRCNGVGSHSGSERLDLDLRRACDLVDSSPLLLKLVFSEWDWQTR